MNKVFILLTQEDHPCLDVCHEYWVSKSSQNRGLQLMLVVMYFFGSKTPIISAVQSQCCASSILIKEWQIILLESVDLPFSHEGAYPQVREEKSDFFKIKLLSMRKFVKYDIAPPRTKIWNKRTKIKKLILYGFRMLQYKISWTNMFHQNINFMKTVITRSGNWSSFAFWKKELRFLWWLYH